jgi:hypothetical protein
VPLSTVVTAVVQFLRAGYPQGVPERDYLPLFALLCRRLSDEEVSQVADALSASQDTASAAALHAAISRVTRDAPRAEDVTRVSACLAAGGWPLADVAELYAPPCKGPAPSG